MKVFFAIVTLFLLSAGEAANLRKLEEDETALPGSPEYLLKSPECADFMEKVAEEVKKLIGYGEYSVTNYVCNPIERAAIKETVAGAEVAVAAAEEGGLRRLEDAPVQDPCKLALDQVILESKTKTLKAMRSESACKNEIRNELAKIGDEANRRLFIGAILNIAKTVAPTILTVVSGLLGGA